MNTIIRASSLPGYGDCERRWAARTLADEIAACGYKVEKDMKTSIGATVGTATHGGAAYLMSEKMATGELGNQTEAEQRALGEFDETIRQGVIWDDSTPHLVDAQKQVVRMLKVFRHAVAPEIQPIAVEQRLEAQVAQGFMLSGQSDLQLIEPESIDDLKTGKILRQHYAQIGSYSLLSRTAHPEIQVKKLRVNFIPRVPVSKPQPAPVIEEYEPSVAENAAMSALGRIVRDVTEFRRRVATGDAPPEHAFLANPASLLCSPKWCPAWGSNFCREHRKDLKNG